MHPLLSFTGKHIVLDLIESWPASVLSVLENNRELIKQFIDEEIRVELLSREDIKTRLFPPINPHKQQFLEVDQLINNILMGYSFIGFHATRLTQPEISNVIHDGLRPLTLELVKEKTGILLRDNYISASEAELIVQNNSSHEKYREKMVWLFHCISTLTDSGGLFKLFGYWGGEAIYRHFQEDLDSSPDLKLLGQPCIVVCFVPGVGMETMPTTSDRMIRYWNSLKDLEPITIDFDHHVKHKVGVIKVISQDDDLFDQLTHYSNW